MTRKLAYTHWLVYWISTFVVCLVGYTWLAVVLVGPFVAKLVGRLVSWLISI